IARAFHTPVAADVSRRILSAERMAPTDVGGYRLLAISARCELYGLAKFQKAPEHWRTPRPGGGTEGLCDFSACGLQGLRRFLSPMLLVVLLSLAGGLAASGQTADDKQATFFMGRVKYSANDGNDCTGVGEELMQLVSKASTIKVQEERRVRLTDPELFETPFLFMNGHNDFVLTEPELANLRKYLSHGGFYFASACCDRPGFPKAWRREFSRVFPNEKVKPIPYEHLIYRSFYKIDRIRCRHEPRDIQLEGIFYQGNLVAVMCDDGLCCAFSENNTCNPAKGISPEDGKKLALNIAVYALTH
ncbi:MAG: DUF4159 domain-containing protein, partial [Verrucomicrobia bacterium]|nr:DUF4159 domain-containing protein [Verrucomicrobiota bacterium]